MKDRTGYYRYYIFCIAGKPKTRRGIINHIKSMNPPQAAVHEYKLITPRQWYSNDNNIEENEEKLLAQASFLKVTNSRVVIEGGIYKSSIMKAKFTIESYNYCHKKVIDQDKRKFLILTLRSKTIHFIRFSEIKEQITREGEQLDICYQQ